MSDTAWAALYAVFRDADPRNRARLVVQERIRRALEHQTEVKSMSKQRTNAP